MVRLRPVVALAAALLVAGCVSTDTTRSPTTDASMASTWSSGPLGPAGSTTSGGNDPGVHRPYPGCSGEGTARFSNSPMRLEDFDYLLPYGLMVGAHVTPIDHMYFSPPRPSARDAYEVRAIADGVIFSMQPRDVNVDANKPKAREWRMDIAHTCTFHSYFDLLTSLEPSLESAWNQSRGKPWEGIRLSAGQLVGRIGSQTLDFGVYDYNVTLPGFIVPAHYSEPWKLHTVDPFPYFDEPLRSQLLSKMMRKAEPRAGKIDYDVDGRMVGNWFAVGTGGYGDGGGPRWDYWEGHLALAYDYLDPTQVRVSIGNWSGQSRQWGVVGNAPDPALVGVEQGRIKLEVAQFSHLARNRPEASGFGGPNALRPGDDVYAVNGMVQGVVLLQLMEPRLLKVEVFPGKAAADVTDFTSAARMYER
jgi:hypothetical protein